MTGQKGGFCEEYRRTTYMNSGIQSNFPSLLLLNDSSTRSVQQNESFFISLVTLCRIQDGCDNSDTVRTFSLHFDSLSKQFLLSFLLPSIRSRLYVVEHDR